MTAAALCRLVTFRIGSMTKYINISFYDFIQHGMRVTLYVLVRVATA